MAKSISAGSLVVVHCCSPKEKIWGVILRLDGIGVVVRGLDLNSVEDWFRQEAGQQGCWIAPSTVFVPMHRVERIFLDEDGGAVEGIGERFRRFTGRDPVETLMGDGE